MKNNQLTQLDTNQVIRACFEEGMDAQRVMLVGGEKLDITIDSDKITEAIKDGLKNIKLPQTDWPLTNNLMPVEIERNVFIPTIEVKTIEIPTIIQHTEYKTIEIPMIVEKIVYIDKPIFIKETEIKTIEVEKHFYPNILKVTAIIQATVMVCILLMNFFRK